MKQTKQANKSNILVVDDKPVNLKVLIAMLTEQGYLVRPAISGQLALTAVQETPPDLILLDINMPGLNGYEVCQQLKADEKTRDIPVIFISALDETWDKVTAFTVGGVDYITKPFQFEEVLARINTHLTICNLQRSLQEQVAELDAFAHTVAHDLKGPLSSITASIAILSEEIAPMIDEDVQQLLQVGANAGRRMSNIIDELLLLASVRKGEVQMTSLNMGDIVTQVKNRLLHMVEEYQAEIITPPNWSPALGYAPWIEEVWANYLSNALKYGGDPPRLELGSTPQPDGMFRFWIRDNGPGLTPADQAILFTEFTRLNEVRAQGHGLGLSIVRRIVKKLGGQVGVESEGLPGKGSVFYFTLPTSLSTPV